MPSDRVRVPSDNSPTLLPRQEKKEEDTFLDYSPRTSACSRMMRPKDLRQGSGTKTFLDAMHGGKVHLARFILDALDGRIINSKTENSRTPLMFAACLPDLGTRAKFTRLLLEKGADVNCQDENGRTALSHACEAGHLDVVKLLVQFNADPDVYDAWGNSALMYAAFSGHGPVLEFLVRAFKRLGLRLDRTNNAGHSAVDVANFFGHSQCVQILNFSFRKVVGPADPFADPGTAGGEPNKLPRHILERFSKQLGGNEEQLPAVFQRRLKVGDGGGLWSRFRCPRSQSQEDGGRHSWALPPQVERNKMTEAGQGVAFASKQLQNCQLRDTRGVKSQERQAATSPLEWGKAKSLNLDLPGGRKQSYQGDAGDVKLAARRWKRASLQDDRCLVDKTECRRTESDKSVAPPKHLSGGKNPAEESGRSQRDEATAAAAQKRGNFARHGKLLLARGDADGGKIQGRGPGLRSLGTRLLRRFTAPEFMRMVIDCSPGSSGARGRISRSETFPLSHMQHEQVDSQPSVDSISGVKCEFESSSRSALN